jgi:hypothetical protein
MNFEMHEKFLSTSPILAKMGTHLMSSLSVYGRMNIERELESRT